MEGFCLRYIGTLVGIISILGCSHFRPGTYVEIMELKGRDIYVGGAAAVQTNRALACRLAINRASNALANEFSRNERSVGDEVEQELEGGIGSAFLWDYANSAILNTRVQDTNYSPDDHTCMATVRWEPPIFLKEALLKYAQGVREEEMGNVSERSLKNSPKELGNSGGDASSGMVNRNRQAPLPETAKISCVKEQKELREALNELGQREVTYDHCMHKMEGDVQQCYVFQLPMERAIVREKSARKALKRCEPMQ